jgi:hypothetical protein
MAQHAVKLTGDEIATISTALNTLAQEHERVARRPSPDDAEAETARRLARECRALASRIMGAVVQN